MLFSQRSLFVPTDLIHHLIHLRLFVILKMFAELILKLHILTLERTSRELGALSKLHHLMSKLLLNLLLLIRMFLLLLFQYHYLSRQLLEISMSLLEVLFHTAKIYGDWCLARWM